MTEAVKANIFEPFFTTKDEGKGTGLGLATSHSIVKQSGGHIEVESEPGQGTSFKVYLPFTKETYEAQAEQVDSFTLPQGTETILLAEDEPIVRNMVASMLHDQGYTVLQAINGEEALRVSQKNPGLEIQLLLADIMMPQMNGMELAGQLQIIRPNIRVLLTSGYFDGDIGQRGDGHSETPFIQKPFMPAAIARKIREVLDD